MCQHFLLGDWGTPQNLKKKSEVDLHRLTLTDFLILSICQDKCYACQKEKYKKHRINSVQEIYEKEKFRIDYILAFLSKNFLNG